VLEKVFRRNRFVEGQNMDERTKITADRKTGGTSIPSGLSARRKRKKNQRKRG